MPSIDGLATGIDTTSIINGLLSIQQGQIDTLNARKQKIVEQQTAFTGIEARLLSLQSKLNDLTRADSNAFNRKTIVSSDETLITATVSNEAAAGVYSIRVNSLARNHQIASQSYEAIDSQVAKGDLTLTVGDGDAITIKVSAANNTLEGMANAINGASREVTASIVRDGNGYRLLLASNKSGEANAMQVSFTAADAGEASIATSFDLDKPVQAAADAEIQVGSGDGAIITNVASNQVDDLFTGITMDLHKVSEGEEIRLTVGNDIEAARTAITNFVDAYNEVVKFTSDQNKYDPTSKTASTLFGNRTLLSITAKLNTLVTQSLPGIDSDTKPNRLASLGIRTDNSGKLTIQTRELNDALNGKYKNNNISASDITAVFGYAGKSDSDFIRFIGASSDTQMSPMRDIDGRNQPVPYQVQVTRAAQQGKLVGTNALASSIVIDDTNNELTISIDGHTSKDLTLRAGTYTREELADELEHQINNNDELVGRAVRAAVVDQKIMLTSLTYGQSSELSELSGSALNALGLDGSESGRGENVAGRFVFELDGQTFTEEASGQGRVLSGLSKNKHTADLKVQVSLVQEQITQGSTFDANVSVSRGIGEGLDDLVNSLMRNDRVKTVYGEREVLGLVSSAKKEFTDRIGTVDASIARLNARFDAQRTALLTQFNGLESRVSDLQSVGNMLNAQLTSLSSLR